MAVEIYQVVTPFEFENRMTKRGEEIACRSSEGEDLVKAKLVVKNDRELDPNTKKDKALIDAANDRAHAKHEAEVSRESEREEVKNENAAEHDARRAAHIERVKKAVPDDAEYVHKASLLPDDKLEELANKLESDNAEKEKKVRVEDQNEVTNIPVKHVQSPRK